MAKTILGDSPILPDIDRQIEFIKHLRKDIIPSIVVFQRELDTIFAIEQSLIAAKILAASEKIERDRPSPQPALIANEDYCKSILSFLKLKVTTVRMEVLKAILSKGQETFSIVEIDKTIANKNGFSKSSIVATFDLFKTRGLIVEKKKGRAANRIGRPQKLFCLVIDGKGIRLTEDWNP